MRVKILITFVYRLKQSGGHVGLDCSHFNNSSCFYLNAVESAPNKLQETLHRGGENMKSSPLNEPLRTCSWLSSGLCLTMPLSSTSVAGGWERSPPYPPRAQWRSWGQIEGIAGVSGGVRGKHVTISLSMQRALSIRAASSPHCRHGPDMSVFLSVIIWQWLHLRL